MPLKLTCSTAAMRHAVRIASTVVPNNSPKAILVNLLLRTTDETAHIIATDTEVSITVELDDVNKTCQPGEVLLAAKRISQILTTTNSDTITLDEHNGLVHVTTDGSEFKLATESPAEFPTFPALTGTGSTIRVAAGVLADALRLTKFCVDPTSTRYALCGVLFDPAKDKLTLAATDTRRLSCSEIEAECDGTQTGVLPVKALSSLGSMLGDIEGQITLKITDKAACVITDKIVLHTRLPEGRFPRYRDVIPKKHESSFDVGRDELLAGVNQAAIMSSEETRGMRLRITPTELHLSCESVDIGRSAVSVPVDTQIEDMTITLDPYYLRQYLQAVPAESGLSVKVGDADSAVVLECGSNVYVVMPISK